MVRVLVKLSVPLIVALDALAFTVILPVVRSPPTPVSTVPPLNVSVAIVSRLPFKSSSPVELLMVTSLLLAIWLSVANSTVSEAPIVKSPGTDTMPAVLLSCSIAPFTVVVPA